MKRYFLGLLFIVFCCHGQAMVNMRNASYNETWVDFIDPGAGIEMKIDRFYSSRSLFIGMFGYGWCSRFETHLTITSDGILNLTECGGGLEVTYYPNNFDVKGRDYTIARIIKDMQSTKALNASDIANLKAQLRSNTKMRFEYAKKLGLVDDKKIKKPGNSFFARAKGFEKIVFDGRTYKRRLYSGVTETYNSQGQLTMIQEPTGEFLKIKYRGRQIQYIKAKDGRSLTFTYDAQGKLKSIFNGKGLSVSYEFSGDELRKVTNMWSKVYNFHYDKHHNMSKVEFPDKTEITMTYDTNKDWIKRYTDREGCTEEFKFTGNRENYKGEFTRSCKGQPKPYSGYHEFWYRNYPNASGKYLQRVYETYRSSSRDVNFHAYLGRPTKVIEDRVFFLGYSYYENGFTNTREDITYQNIAGRRGPPVNWQKANFEYDRKTYFIEKVSLKNLDSQGKVTDNRELQVRHNSFGQITRVVENRKKFVKISYDKSGKVSELVNERGDTIELRHTPGGEKPVQIKLNGVGAVKVSYNEDGEVESLESVGKRNIATSVVEKFLEMVNFLGPLGDHLKI
jgi:YD repeat-containing protein